MDIVRVRYFLAVCRHGSFTAAAKVCGVSQPSVTTGVRRLERAVGGPLLERRHPVRLTKLGAKLRPMLEELQSVADRISGVVEQASGGDAPGLADSAGIIGRGTRACELPVIAWAEETAEEVGPDLAPLPAGPAQVSDRWTDLLQRSGAAIARSETAIRLFHLTWDNVQDGTPSTEHRTLSTEPRH